jgi:hypothetical protein
MTTQNFMCHENFNMGHQLHVRIKLRHVDKHDMKSITFMSSLNFMYINNFYVRRKLHVIL